MCPELTIANATMSDSTAHALVSVNVAAAEFLTVCCLVSEAILHLVLYVLVTSQWGFSEGITLSFVALSGNIV